MSMTTRLRISCSFIIALTAGRRTGSHALFDIHRENGCGLERDVSAFHTLDGTVQASPSGAAATNGQIIKAFTFCDTRDE